MERNDQVGAAGRKPWTTPQLDRLPVGLDVIAGTKRVGTDTGPAKKNS